MKKAGKNLVQLVVCVVILLAVVVVALRYNVYPYLFCGKNNDARMIKRTYISEDIEAGEEDAVMLEIRLDRFSRFKNNVLYDGEDKRAGLWMYEGNVLLDRESAESEMQQNQLDGMNITEEGTLAERFPYVVLQRDYQNWNEEEKRHVYTVYVDLGPCYWYLYTQDTDVLKELRNTSSVSVYISEGDADFTEDEKIVLWK